MKPLKYLSNLWRTLDIPSINCEISLISYWSANYFLVAATVANQVPTFTMTDRKLYVPVVTLSNPDNTKLLEQLKSGFTRIMNWSKCKSKRTTEAQNGYLDF